MEAGIEVYGCGRAFAVVGACVAISAIAVNDAGAGLVAPDAVIGGRLLGQSEADEVDGLLAVVGVGRAPAVVGAFAGAFCVVVVVVSWTRNGQKEGLTRQMP